MQPSDTQMLLGELKFSEALSPAARTRLASIARVIDFDAGDVLFREGAIVQEVYLIHTGRVVLQMNVPGRGQVTVLTLGPGDLCGLSALLGGGPMTATACAAEASRLLALPVDELLAQCEADGGFGYQFLRRVAGAMMRRLVATRLQLLDLYSQPADLP